MGLWRQRGDVDLAGEHVDALDGGLMGQQLWRLLRQDVVGGAKAAGAGDHRFWGVSKPRLNASATAAARSLTDSLA